MDIEKIKQKLKELTPYLKEQYGISTIGIFGSYIRGEEDPESDLDILVEFEERADFFHLVGLSIFLEEKLGQKVDVVPKRALRAEIKESVLKEAISL